MRSLEAELADARSLSVAELADAIESIGFECTRCGACCTGHGEDEHTATVFPDEIRILVDDGQSPADGGVAKSTLADRGGGETNATAANDDADSSAAREWRDVARPMPYGLSEGEDGLEGETFEWALRTDGCGDCTFYEEDDAGVGSCTVHDDRPLICRTYPFSVDLTNAASEEPSDSRDGGATGTSQPMGETVDGEGVVRAHECEGLGTEIPRADAEDLARALKERAVREREEAIAVRDAYEPADPSPGEIVVHDSEGAKRLDGTPLER
ncbi:YkgJ family cysteine cluster protein [Natrialba sp. INN-245]|uniref:YkgJ family cysteine cluster protein n=1 Tax=Natrialba sp. INN-245 TaxID=2690967 RepID=UPI0013117107|nr:YkgJ family cysteine cluster protein [Natrialba sp. INN-245]